MLAAFPEEVKSVVKTIFVSQFASSPVGHGGNHRAYQITHDLQAIVGEEHVRVFNLSQWRQLHPTSQPPTFVRRILPGIKRRFRYYGENPLRLWFKTGYFASSKTPPDFLRGYQQAIAECGKSVVVVIEDTGFTDILMFNIKRGIPTIACIQNLESLDLGSTCDKTRTERAARMVDLAVELDILAQCSERLFISKVEAGLIGGIGLDAHYYPYLPVDEIRENLVRIRQQRLESSQERGLFLMVGSAGHPTTREAFVWFVEQAQVHGLPTDVRVVVSGSGTDKLLPSRLRVPGLECRGWLPQAELDQLLITTQAVLVPQFRGFGALTRLPEMACAGIPTLVSRHPTFALDVPPGIHIVENTWGDWKQAMLNVMHGGIQEKESMDAYLEWEDSQPQTLRSVMKRLLRRNTRETRRDA